MNTSQITRALKQDRFTKRTFRGVFPSDKLPKTLDKFPCAIVANTDPSNEPGTHWVAFYFPSEHKGEMFDSFGRSLEYYKDTFRDFLDKHDTEWEFNTRTLQSVWSDVCGQYCLFYLCQRSRGHSLSKIAHVFNNNTMSNDAKVSQFVKNHFRTVDKQLHVDHNQTSKKRIL